MRAVMSDALQRSRLFLAYLLAKDGMTSFDVRTGQGLQVLDARAGWVKCNILVDQTLQNRHGTLHGGCIGTAEYLADAA